MQKEEAYILGRVLKPDGFQGKLLVSLDTDEESKYLVLKEIWLGHDRPEKVYNVKEISLNRNHTAVLLLDGINTFDEAKALVKRCVWVPLSFLPPLTGDSFYPHEICGFSVMDKQLGNVGTATGVLDLNHQKLLEIDVHGKEVLLPLLPEFYLGIDREKRTLFVSIPDGLLDVYTSDPGSF